jgi:hypothetical protein
VCVMRACVCVVCGCRACERMAEGREGGARVAEVRLPCPRPCLLMGWRGALLLQSVLDAQGLLVRSVQLRRNALGGLGGLRLRVLASQLLVACVCDLRERNVCHGHVVFWFCVLWLVCGFMHASRRHRPAVELRLFESCERCDCSMRDAPFFA